MLHHRRGIGEQPGQGGGSIAAGDRGERHGDGAAQPGIARAAEQCGQRPPGACGSDPGQRPRDGQRFGLGRRPAEQRQQRGCGIGMARRAERRDRAPAQKVPRAAGRFGAEGDRRQGGGRRAVADAPQGIDRPQPDEGVFVAVHDSDQAVPGRAATHSAERPCAIAANFLPALPVQAIEQHRQRGRILQLAERRIDAAADAMVRLRPRKGGQQVRRRLPLAAMAERMGGPHAHGGIVVGQRRDQRVVGNAGMLPAVGRRAALRRESEQDGQGRRPQSRPRSRSPDHGGLRSHVIRARGSGRSGSARPRGGRIPAAARCPCRASRAPRCPTAARNLPWYGPAPRAS